MRKVYRINEAPEEALRNQAKLGASLYGTAAISPETVEADTISSFEITYTAGQTPLKAGTGISLHIPDQGWSAPVLTPGECGYVEVDTDAGAELETYLPEGPNTRHWICIKVVRGNVKPGDKINIYYGGKSSGAPGAEAVNYPGVFTFMVAFTLNPFPKYAESLWSPQHPGYCIYANRLEKEPQISVTGNLAERLHLTLPSNAVTGSKIGLKAQLMDRCHNPASRTNVSEAKLYWDNGMELGEINFNEKAPFRRELSIAVPEGEGGCYLFAEWNGQTWMSNPVEVKKQVDEFIYWGDLHAQGAQSDGYGEPEEYFRRARYDACLDVSCLTDHSDGICFPIMLGSNEWRKDKWDNLNRVTEKVYEPGKFVVFPAMELSSDVKKYPSGLRERNHRNAYFFDENDSVCFSWREFPGSIDWYRFLRPFKYMIIPHTHCARLDCCYHNPRTERVIEIKSDKGSGENFHRPDISATKDHGGVLEFLKRGFRVGMVGSGDYHHNTPGRHFPQKEKPGFANCQLNMGGLAAIRAPKLDRESIWDALYRRRTYATTGVRILLDVTMKFGDSVTRMAGEKVAGLDDVAVRKFTVNYGLTGPLKRIELVRNGDLRNPVAVYEPESKTDVFRKNEMVNDVTLTDNSDLHDLWLNADFPPMPPHKFIFYYVRVLQQDNEIAWSSPIWLSDRPILPLLDA